MKKLKLSTFLDGIFVFILSFFIFYALIRGGVKSIWLTLLLSVVISSIITLLFCTFMDKKNDKKDVLLKDKKEYDAFLKTVYLMHEKEVLKLTKSYYAKQGFIVTQKSNVLFIEEKNSYVFNCLSPEKTGLEKAISAYKKTPKGASTIIIACEYDGSVFEFFSGFEKVKLYNARDFYLCLKESELLPEINVENDKKFKLKNPFKGVLKRENSKKFLLWGAVFLLFSTVTYFKWFYLIVGTIFLAVSCYLRFFKSFDKKDKAGLC